MLQSQSWTHVEIDQLAGESKSGHSASYTYDAKGNRATKVLGGVTQSYSYDDADKLTAITQGGNTVKSFGYDTCGRTTSVVVGANPTTLAYDFEGRITTITYPNSSTNTFTYNGLDTRVGKVDSTGTKTFLRDGAAVTDPVINDGASYTPGISERRSGTTKFYHLDLIGTTERLTNTSQTTSDTREYDAFGMLTSSSGSTPTPFGFAAGWAYQEDPDSGLKLLGHRYYDPSIGRFLTRDPIADGRNWYSYCSSSPTCSADESGLETFAGDTHGYPAGAWTAPGNWGSHNGLTKKEVMKIIMETNDDAIGIWGHGRKGKISVNATESLTPGDIDIIRDYRDKHHKKKFNYFMVNQCDVMSDPKMINAILKVSKTVQGYKGTCVGISALRDCWDKPVPEK